jgi:hypothetical protein
LFVVLTNKVNHVSGIYRIPIENIDDKATLKHQIELTVGKSGAHAFTAVLYDNYGQSNSVGVKAVATERDE